MSQYRRQFGKLSAACKKPMLGLSGVAVVLAIAACDRQREIPGPPQSPPKPVTSAPVSASAPTSTVAVIGHISTAHFVVPMRIVLPRRGWM
jgi:hypothetical protein